jgi:hypothetical protein
MLDLKRCACNRQRYVDDAAVRDAMDGIAEGIESGIIEVIGNKPCPDCGEPRSLVGLTELGKQVAREAGPLKAPKEVD